MTDKPTIKTALERFQSYCAAKGIPEKSVLAHIHKISQFEEHERKELRAAYEAHLNEVERLKAKVECLEGKLELEQAKLRGEEETVKRVVAHSEALKAENDALRKQVAELETETAKDHVKIMHLKDALSAYGDPDVFEDDED